MPELDYEDKLEVYVLLNKLIQSGLDSQDYKDAKSGLHCIMRRLDNEYKNNLKRRANPFEESKAQIIVRLLKSTISIIALRDPAKANYLQSWIDGQKNSTLRSYHQNECPSYRPVTDFGGASASSRARARAHARASQAARGKHIYQHGLQQFESISEGRSRQVLFTESRRRSGARPLHF